MRFEVNEKPSAPTIKYPCLMRTRDGLIVLVVARGSGTVVKPTTEYEPGYYSDAWNTDDFTPFTGSVTLSND